MGVDEQNREMIAIAEHEFNRTAKIEVIGIGTGVMDFKIVERRSSMVEKVEEEAPFLPPYSSVFNPKTLPLFNIPLPGKAVATPPQGNIRVLKEAVAMCMAKEGRADQRSSLAQICFREVTNAVKTCVSRQERRELARKMSKEFYRQSKAAPK